MTYPDLKQMILAHAVKSFDDWFGFIEQKKFMEDTGMSIRRLQALRLQPGDITLNELMKLCTLLDMDAGDLGNHFVKGFQVRRQ